MPLVISSCCRRRLRPFLARHSTLHRPFHWIMTKHLAVSSQFSSAIRKGKRVATVRPWDPCSCGVPEMAPDDLGYRRLLQVMQCRKRVPAFPFTTVHRVLMRLGSSGSPRVAASKINCKGLGADGERAGLDPLDSGGNIRDERSVQNHLQLLQN
jgi:hypothetical protein